MAGLGVPTTLGRTWEGSLLVCWPWSVYEERPLLDIELA